jgi:hypothetical protein
VAALVTDDGRLQDGRLQETVAIWRPATWLKITRAFKPLAKQRSYSAEKSAVETAGVGQTGPSTLAHAPPLTTLAHLGETREVGGEVKCVSAGWQACDPKEGEAWQAWRVDRHPAELLHPPSPAAGGETAGGAGVRV